VHGTALGGGLEVALACHWRVAVKDAKFGVPEVKLGLLPGAGGTQRLPRVVGVEKALEMCTSGAPIGAVEAEKLGLVDKLVEGDLAQHAIAYAHEVADVRPIPISSQRDEKLEAARANPGLFDEFRKANARKMKGFDAPEANIKAVQAATQHPYEQGVLEERRLFMELMTGTQARAQQYFFFAERKASKIEGVGDDVRPRPINKVGVIGAGTMGGGISMNFLSAGIPSPSSRRSRSARPRHGRDAQELRGERRQGPHDARTGRPRDGRLTPTLDLEQLADCDLVIEAVFENMDVKKEIFGKLDRICKPGAILRSNTSYLNIDEIAAVTPAAGRRRPALLLARQRHETAGGRARRQDGGRRAGDRDGGGQEDQESRGRRGRLRRLHRQPHADAAPDRGDQAAAGRRQPRTDRPRPRRVRHADGSVPDGRPRGRRHRLAPRPHAD
jgi:3-hydroxyacyl-CoA dehydrogenase